MIRPALALLLVAAPVAAQPHSDRRVKTHKPVGVTLPRLRPRIALTPSRPARVVVDSSRGEVTPVTVPRVVTVGSREPWPILLVPLLAGAVMWTVTRGPAATDSVAAGGPVGGGTVVVTPEPGTGVYWSLAYIIIGGGWLALRKRGRR